MPFNETLPGREQNKSQNRLENTAELSKQHIQAITRSTENWTGFLDSAAKMYKYPFADQVLIHAQRPDATACASLELWNHPLHRWVKKGSKGIALIDRNGDEPRLKYVFDVSDTRGWENTRPPYIWQMQSDHETHISKALSTAYGEYAQGETLKERILNLAKNLSEDYTFPESVNREYSEEILRASLAYIVLSRCGLSTEGLEKPLEGISRIETPEEAGNFGDILEGLSREILTQIENAVKDHERLKAWQLRERGEENERDTVSSGRGLSDTRSGIGRPDGSPDREVREDEAAIPGGASGRAVRSPADHRETDGTSGGHRRSGAGPDRTDHGENAGKQSSPRQGNEPDGLGAAHEQSESRSGGDRQGRTDLQLDPPEAAPSYPEGDTTQNLTHETDNTVESAASSASDSTAVSKRTAENRQLFLFPNEEEQQRSISKDINTLPPSVIRQRPGTDEPPKPLIEPLIVAENEREGRESAEPTSEELPDIPEAKGTNYRITDDNLGVGGQKTKYRSNVAAIRTLQEIEKAGRAATPEEQETLSKYVGWGGISQAFDAEHENWKKEYAELKELLPEEEYASARASTLNAHYTAPVVIKAIYEAVERMGFEKGNILEPAMGVGNFFGLLPESMENSRLYGVELDSVTGRIAKQLYPQAGISVSGFEKTGYPDNFFDLAVGNVPFGAYKVADPKYDKQNLLIHDYFFAKTLDQVRPGGVVAFVTSNGTLDKANPSVRKYLAERAELIGAVRLPNDAFKANAGTEVTTDILFLQKRERPLTVEPNWVHLGRTEDGVPVNSYFAENPGMMLGKMVFDKSMYGNEHDTACIPDEGMNLETRLREALSNVRGQFTERTEEQVQDKRETIPADPRVRNYSYTIVDEGLFYRENSVMVKPKLSADATERAKAMVELRDCTRALVACQLADESDENVRVLQSELDSRYDRFTETYGLINDKANARAFDADSSYYLLCSLEVLDENGNLECKADMFTKRTIRQRSIPLAVDTASEALTLSLAEKASVDLVYMQSLLPEGTDKNAITARLRGVVFPNPERRDENGNPKYETADEYLSGNVRRKLEVARKSAEADPATYAHNVVALELAQPKDLEAHEIDVRLGATWVDAEYVEQFMFELLEASALDKRLIRVHYSPHTSEWFIENKNRGAYGILTSATWGTEDANAYHIIEDTLNLRDVRIYKSDENDARVLDRERTALAQQKQEMIREAFKEWIFKDPERRHSLVEKYNNVFNSTRLREHDGSHITFEGMNPEISLRKHQADAIARILYGGNTLLAHEVGAGKTFEMVGAAMESKRLGLAQKSLFVVPNHLTEQMASEFMTLYPAANILVATKKDFETANRKKFCARIATGDYDAVIIGHSQFEKIPLSQERQQRYLREQIEEITDAIRDTKAEGGSRFTIKQLEKTQKNLETRMSRLLATDRKDDVVTFEELGVDRVFVDEAHSYKNLYLYTKMRNVAGIPQTEAQKSSDLYAKCRYMDEQTGNRGIIFATGTPVSNSMTELYTMMRYLQNDRLREQGLGQFDAWGSTFGETTTSIELAPEGTGYRARTRFAKFYNLPELMKTFGEVTDIKTADTLNLPRPKANFKVIAVKPTGHQEELVTQLSERAAAVHDRKVEPHEDNMLKITSDGRKIGLDQRLINPLLPDDPGSKVNACIGNVHRIWGETKKERLTQLVFCDFSTPDKDKFNVYDDIKKKLVDRGVPEKEIAFIHDADTEVKKKELFAQVRKGQVRVLMGSTAKMGAGTNVQDKLIALHDLDCPWRPADLEQRSGRIVRQGNQNAEVDIYRYVTESTFDAYLYQTVENKQKFISQIMTSKSPVRSCEDVDDSVLSYAEVKALCIGDPRIKEKMDLDIQVAKLRMLEGSHRSEHYRLEDRVLKHLPLQIERTEERIFGLENDLKQYNSRADETFSMTVSGRVFGEKEKSYAGEAILEKCKTVQGVKSSESIGEYMGFQMQLSFNHAKGSFELNLQREGGVTHRVELGESTLGNITRISHAMEIIPERLESDRGSLAEYRKHMADAKEELGKPFPREEELKVKSARLAELDILLNMDTGRQNTAEEQAVTETQTTESAEANHEAGFPDGPNMTEVQAAESKASLIQNLDKSADGNTHIEGKDIGYTEESYVAAANQVKYEAQQARTAGSAAGSRGPQVGQRVSFQPLGSESKLIGNVVAADDKTVTMQCGNKLIPAVREKGAFSEAPPLQQSHTKDFAKNQAQKLMEDRGNVFFASKEGTFKGEIIGKTPTFAIQKINNETAILHRLKDLEAKDKNGQGLLKEGENVSIVKDGTGVTIDPWDKDREEKEKIRERQKSRGSRSR